MLLNAVVTTSGAVAATRSRKTKIAALAAVLRECAPDEIATVVHLLTGEPRQGRIGVGWATLAAAREQRAPSAAGVPTVTVADLDGALDRIETTTGAGSATARQAVLGDLFARATDAEVDFIVRLLTGELRQGALAGLMADAIALAADGTGRRGPARRDARRRPRPTSRAARARAAKPHSPGSACEVLRPVLPMLAASAPSVGEALAATGRASVEWKLDGARIQVHRDGDDVRVVHPQPQRRHRPRSPKSSRSCARFPRSAFVLDGEAIGLTDDALPRRFQDTMSRFGTDDATGHAMTLAPFFFDILHLDGDDLLDRTLARAGDDPRRARARVARPGARHRRSRRGRGLPRATRSPPATKA